MRAMRSLAGLEKEHSSMLQVATESLQPHWHWSRWPTRRTSLLGFSEAVWARAAATRAMASRTAYHAEPARNLLLNRCMLRRITHHYRAGVLHPDLRRYKANKCSA